MIFDQSITQKDFAHMVGISEARVSQLVADGVLARGATCRAWLLAYCNRLRDQAGGRLGRDAEALDLVAERANLARHQGAIAELRARELGGELIRVDAVRSALAGVLSATRDAFLGLPDRMATVLAVESDPAAVHQALSGETHRILGTLVAGAARLGKADQEEAAP